MNNQKKNLRVVNRGETVEQDSISSNEKSPWWIKFGITVGVASTVVGILISLIMILNNSFSVSELEDFGVNTIVPIALETANEASGVPTAVLLGTPDAVSPLIVTSKTIEGSYNLILIGNDARSDRVEPDCPNCILVHTDAFVYVNIQFEPLRITMISIPRELYLRVDGIVDSQVSQIYARGGLEWIKTWSEAILGVEIDGVMAIDMDGFVEVVDRMGGIIVVPDESFEDKCGNEFYRYEVGLIHYLDGFETLCYARMRMYNPRGYFARQERHMEILRGTINAVRSEFDNTPLATSVMMVSIYFEYVETDMSPELIARITSEVAITRQTLGSGALYMNTISQDMLELYPRPDPINSPYLYKPTFVISDWVQCLLNSPFECEIE